jgi:hypothetical protein
MNDVLFKEKQKFTQWWLWLILLSVNGMVVYGFFDLYLSGESQRNSESDHVAMWIALLLIPLLSLLFVAFRLDTLVKSDGVYFRFFPIHRKYRYYPWEQLAELYVREYAPILEYGGWGIRWGLFGKGLAYNIKGNMGLQLLLKNKKRILIGTNKPKELKDVLERIGVKAETKAD